MLGFEIVGVMGIAYFGSKLTSQSFWNGKRRLKKFHLTFAQVPTHYKLTKLLLESSLKEGLNKQFISSLRGLYE